MSNLAELLAQRTALEAQIQQLRQSERQSALKTIQELIDLHGIDVVKEFSGTKKSGKDSSAVRTPGANKGTSVAAKYRNTATGDAWSGRGLQPKWLKAQLAQGKTLEEFKV